MFWFHYCESNVSPRENSSLLCLAEIVFLVVDDGECELRLCLLKNIYFHRLHAISPKTIAYMLSLLAFGNLYDILKIFVSPIFSDNFFRHWVFSKKVKFHGFFQNGLVWVLSKPQIEPYHWSFVRESLSRHLDEDYCQKDTPKLFSRGIFCEKNEDTWTLTMPSSDELKYSIWWKKRQRGIPSSITVNLRREKVLASYRDKKLFKNQRNLTK